MKRESLFLLWLVLILFSPLVVFPQEGKTYKTALFPSGTKISMEVAETEPARQLGLMFREQLLKGTGMLFIFPFEAPHRFWMKNCKFPIDIIWLNKGRKIVYVAQNVPPCKGDPCQDYGPANQSALYVIETSAGFFKKERLRIGMTVGF